MPDEPDLAENADEAESLPDDPLASEAVQGVLEEMTSVYASDNEPIPVKLAGRSAAHPEGNCVFVNPDLPEEMDPDVLGPNILRLLDDLLAHEVAHVNWSDLKSKEKFAECYPGWGKIPGHVANILEDEYVDHKRKQHWYGMRSKLAYYVWLHMNTEDRAPPIDEVYDEHGRTQALMTALFQTALAGYIKGDTDAIPGDILEFASYADVLVERVRHEDDPDERFKLFHAVMQLLIRYAPDPDDFDTDEMEGHPRESHDGGDGERGAGEPPDAPYSPEPEVDLPPEMEAALEDLLEDLLEAGEFPEPDGPEPDSPEVESEMEDAGELGDSPSSGGSGDAGEGDGESEPDGSGSGGDEAGDGGSGEGESEKPGGGSGTDSTGDSGESGRSRDVSTVLDEYDPSDLKVVND